MTWTSPNGTPLAGAAIAKVDLSVLAQLYAEESSDLEGPSSATWTQANLATRHAWQLGYQNPRVAHG